MSRRARKGFTLKYNPDAHWSSALYRGLNLIQYTDGVNILNINRDDASGFRLDTLSTHKQHQSLCIVGSPALTTRTDYVNKYKSILQTTNYNFTGSNTTGEVCAGVVKPHVIYPKNSAQHAADLKMLLQKEELQSAFLNPYTHTLKQITCVRVDGSADEGPSHLEVQFWWTEYHLDQGNFITLVSTRSSGASYLNRVELQNGCLAKAHANLFIPSTLNGSCCSSKTGGSIDEAKLKENLESAMEVYINRCDGCSCGDATINLYKGADSTEWQNYRPLLNVFLKGNQQKKRKLKLDHPETFTFFERVWSLRNRHMVPNLPEKYVFFLKCCCQPGCVHPLCQKKVANPSTDVPTTWYPNGPPVSFLPLPILDLQRIWGQTNCPDCNGYCYGHYLKPADDFKDNQNVIATPPSVVSDFFAQNEKKIWNESEVEQLARKVLLPPREVEFWLQHLLEVHNNRQRGAAKAAETRKKRKLEQLQACNAQSTTLVWLCGVCKGEYKNETDVEENWIGCDNCPLGMC